MKKDPNIKRWEEQTLSKVIGRFSERDLEEDRVGLPEKIDQEYSDKLGFPGEYPFTRGARPTMYRGRVWTMRQYAGFSTAKESNERYRYLLSQGTTGLSVAFDLPTQIGYDSSDKVSLGEVGKVGVPIDTLYDMEVLFDQIPLDKVSTSMTINSPAAILLAMYVAVGEKQGVPADKLKGTIQNDILKEYVARGTYIFPPRESIRLITDIFKWCSDHTPGFNTISISGYHIREAGSTAVQEVAFTLANGCTYVEEAIKVGLKIDDFAKRLTFFFNASTNLLEEVAKFRAARRIWAKLMKDKFKAQKEGSMMLKFHTQTAGNTLAAQQIDNNIVRVTIQALAAVLGGTQSLHTNSKDEALSLPTQEAVKTALRTQQVIANESGVANTIDPFGGSYYIEKLTDDIEKEVWDLLDKIDEIGGVVKAIEAGFIQRQIESAAYKYQKEIDEGERIVVGVNKYQEEENVVHTLLKVDPKKEKQQIKSLEDIKAKRDPSKVQEILNRLEKAANAEDNLMPIIIEAVKEYISIGEICSVLRTVFGEYKD